MKPAHGLVTVGALAAACAAGMLVWLNGTAFVTAVPATSEAHAPVIALIRGAFLAIAVGLLLAPPPATTLWWTRVRRAAGAMLACSLAGDLIGGVAPDLTASVGPIDDVHRRLLRLASMASRALPLIVLLAAALPPSPDGTAGEAVSSSWWRRTAWRAEPVVFFIGVTTLPTILAASALIHKEIGWAMPIGADTTVAGCVMAAVRARRRADTVSLLGWTAVSASMIAGLLMGLYAFEGPLPPPSAAGPYGTIARTAMRDAHIAILVLGVAALAFKAARSLAGRAAAVEVR